MRNTSSFKSSGTLALGAVMMMVLRGNNDYGRHSIDDDVRVIQKSGSEISIQAFRRGHQAAPASVMTKAFRRLLKEIE